MASYRRHFKVTGNLGRVSSIESSARDDIHLVCSRREKGRMELEATVAPWLLMGRQSRLKSLSTTTTLSTRTRSRKRQHDPGPSTFAASSALSAGRGSLSTKLRAAMAPERLSLSERRFGLPRGAQDATSPPSSEPDALCVRAALRTAFTLVLYWRREQGWGRQ